MATSISPAALKDANSLRLRLLRAIQDPLAVQALHDLVPAEIAVLESIIGTVKEYRLDEQRGNSHQVR